MSAKLERELYDAIVNLGNQFPLNPARVVAQYKNHPKQLESIIKRLNLATAAITADWGEKVG